MLLGEISDATITHAPLFRVTAKNVSLESKAIDSGVRVKLYVSNPALMYYFIRHCNVGTRHHFAGSLNVSAYTFDDSTRAFSSIRLSVDSVRPLLNVDDDGNVIRTAAVRIRLRDLDPKNELQKLKFIVYKYVWENINNEKIVMSRNLQVDAFALELHQMYEDLVERHILISGFNPVVIEERISRPATHPNTNRPVPRVMQTLYTYNVQVKRLDDWEHPSLAYTALLDNDAPMNASLFTLESNSLRSSVSSTSSGVASAASSSISSNISTSRIESMMEE